MARPASKPEKRVGKGWCELVQIVLISETSAPEDSAIIETIFHGQRPLPSGLAVYALMVAGVYSITE